MVCRVGNGVGKSPTGVGALSRIKVRSVFPDTRVLLSKKEWAMHLNFSEETLRRWEGGIIREVLKLAMDYWQLKHSLERFRRFKRSENLGYRLDGYQRFVLAVIAALRLGLLTEGVKVETYSDVTAWVNDHWEWLSRENFENSK